LPFTCSEQRKTYVSHELVWFTTKNITDYCLLFTLFRRLVSITLEVGKKSSRREEVINNHLLTSYTPAKQLTSAVNNRFERRCHSEL